jgi:hypothetical protein
MPPEAKERAIHLTLDESGGVRTQAEEGMTMLDVIVMLEIALEAVRNKALEKSKVVVPRGINLVPRG